MLSILLVSTRNIDTQTDSIFCYFQNVTAKTEEKFKSVVMFYHPYTVTSEC